MTERLAKLGDADLRRMGASLGALQVRWGDDYEKEGLLVNGQQFHSISFRNVNEEWKIGEMGPARGPVTARRSSPDS
jgi:hypothetical protein